MHFLNKYRRSVSRLKYGELEFTKSSSIENNSPSNKKHTASLIFLHGSGDTKEGIRHWLRDAYGKEFSFPHMRVVFPQAPARPYSPMNGLLSNVWFDRVAISHDAPEDLKSVDYMCGLVKGLVDEEIKAGIKLNRIIIGGFSMGGALALHMGYRVIPGVAGVVALSSFLPPSSPVFKSIKDNPQTKLPPLFMCHGTDDDVVGYEWGRQTAETFKKLGTACEFQTYAYMDHSMCAEELQSARDWIQEKVQEV